MLAVGVAPAWSEWSPSALVPGNQPDDAGTERTSVGVAANGDLAIAWLDRVATRTAGVWSTTVFPPSPSNHPKLAMNERGDIALAWMQGDNVCLGYRPTGGAWVFPTPCPEPETTFADQTPFVTINEQGDALATWIQTPANVVIASLRPAGGSWETPKQVYSGPDPLYVASDDPPRFNASAALDDDGNALVLWADRYGFREPDALPNPTGPVRGIRQSRRAAGSGSWGAPTAITSRSSNASVSPDYILADVAADSTSGNVVVGLCCFDNSRLLDSGATRYGNGTVAGGVNSGSPSQAGQVGFDVAAARGRVASMGVKRPFTGSPTQVAKAKVAASGAPAPEALPDQPSVWDSGTSNPVLAVGPDGTALASFQDYLWRSGPSGVFSTAPVWPFGPEPGDTVDLAVNCRGDSLAAAIQTDLKVHYSEFPGGSTAACTGSPGPPDTDGDGIPNSADACPALSDQSAPRNPRTGCPAATTTKTDPQPPATTSTDKTPPVASLSGPKSQKAGSTVKVVVSCGSEACSAAASGSANVPGASKVFKLRSVKKQLAAGRKATLKLRIPKKALRAIRKALRRKRKITAKIKVRVTDARGNSRTSRRSVKLKR